MYMLKNNWLEISYTFSDIDIVIDVGTDAHISSHINVLEMTGLHLPTNSWRVVIAISSKTIIDLVG